MCGNFEEQKTKNVVDEYLNKLLCGHLYIDSKFTDCSYKTFIQ